MGWFLRTSGGECLCAPAVSLWLLLEKGSGCSPGHMELLELLEKVPSPRV